MGGNNERSVNKAYKNKNVKENAAVEENSAYKDKNVDENAALCWSLVSLLYFLVPFPNNRSKTMKNWL